jgi:hypothetical protein
MYAVNPATGRLEDENGNPITGPVPVDQVKGAPAGAGAPLPPAALAANPVEPAAVGPLAPPRPVVLDMGQPEGGQIPSAFQAGAGGPPALAPMPAPAAPAAGKHVEGGVTTVSRTKIAPLEQAGLDREQKALEADKGVTEREAGVLKEKAKADAQAARDQRVAAETHQDAQALLLQDVNKNIEKQSKIHDAAVAERANVKMEKFGAGDPAWVNIGRVLMVGLGELGARLGKTGHNTSLEIINQQADEHYRLERAKIEEADKKVDRSRQGIADARQKKVDDLVDLERDQSAWNLALAAKAKEEAARIGTDHAQVVGEKAALEAEQRAAQHQQKAGALLRQSVESRTSWTNSTGGPTAGDGAGRAAGVQIQKATLAEHGQAALDTADRLHKKGVFLSEDDRQKMQDNMSDMRKMESAGPLAAKAGRATIFARSKYEGLSPEKAELAQSYDILAQKAAAITSPSHDAHEIEHSRSMFDLNAPGIGDVARVQTLQNLRGVVGAARALGGKYSGIAEQGAAASRAAGGTSPEPGRGGGLPPGATPGTMGGKRGYVLNGQFVPIGGP